MLTADSRYHDDIALEAWNTGKKVRVIVLAGLDQLFGRIPHATPAELLATMRAIYHHIMLYSHLVHDLAEFAETNVSSLIIEWAALLSQRAGERKDKLVTALVTGPKFVRTGKGSYAWEDTYIGNLELIKTYNDKALARELD